MSKLDEMRRMREQLHEQRERDAGRGASPAPRPVPRGATSGAAEPASPAAAPPADHAAPDMPTDRPELRGPRPRAAAGAADEQGKCAGCGKLRAMSNGLIAVHQKGLGKICPGSRKEPA